MTTDFRKRQLTKLRVRRREKESDLKQKLEQDEAKIAILREENDRLKGATVIPKDCDFSDAKGYKFLKKLGAGGQGQVWHAKKKTSWRYGDHVVPAGESDVALKFMTSYSGEASGIANLINEGRVMSLFDHENLMSCEPLMMRNYRDLPKNVQTSLEEEARQLGQDVRKLSIPLIEMKYVRGFKNLNADLQSWLNALREWRSPYSDGKPRMHVLTTQLAAFIISRVARGIEEAHTEHNKINKDIKPANVLITKKGTVKLTDFTLTDMVAKEGRALGTISYMSPEQMRNGKIDYATDIYSLNLLFYRILKGALPWGLNENPRIRGVAINREKNLLSQIFERARLGFRDGRKDDKNYLQDPIYSLKEVDDARDKIRCDICKLVKDGLNPKPEERPAAGDYADLLESMIYSIGYGPTNNSLGAAGRLLSRNPLVLDYVINPSNGELRDYNAQYREEPSSLRTITKRELANLAYSCKDPQNTRKWLASFKQGEKRPLPREHLPHIAKVYWKKEDVAATREVIRKTKEVETAMRYEK